MDMCGVIVLVFAFLVLPDPSCSNSDNMALLLGTLKMMQRASCDEDMVSLACPTATTISIQVALYGKAGKDGHVCASLGSNAVEVVEDENCLWPNTMQYSLLQTVVEACQKKPHCKFSTKPRPGLKDPCPRTRKFVDVAFKCRPYEFRSRTCCQDDVIKLSCNPHSRVAIFDAQYGRNAYEPVTCHQTGMPDELCMAPRSLDIVMQICHGKRRCQVEASDRVFGNTCSAKTRTYLKVIYACVPLGVMLEKYESKLEDDEKPDSGADKNEEDKDFFDESEGVGEKWGEPNANPALQLPEETPATTSLKPDTDTTTQESGKKQNELGSSQTKMKEKIFIYIGVGLLIFVLIVVLIFVIRYYRIRKLLSNSKNGDMFSTEPPNVFNEASDIDNDIDVSHISGTFYDPVHPDMILYRDVPGHKGTIRAMRPLSTIYPSGVSMYGNDYVPPPPREIRLHKENEPEEALSPKSLGNYSNSQFYYG
ncbi:unnamed protein product [Chilo suppressalis]|uniref:SUEL-type lectin domain-containing protein n=1 Tax=Chilo suppressalis TaxID=168631 RepID=A0ABN8AQX5_CHISP|nr:unnamed protein product [Chilo suppressalis]